MFSLGAAQQSGGLAEHAAKASSAIASNDAATAKQELLAMLKLEPGNANTYANLGMVEFSQGDYAGSAQSFERALSYAPSLWSARAFLGMDQLRLGAAVQGQKLLEDSLLHVTDKHLHVQAGLDLVRSYGDLGMVDKAEAALRKLQEFDPRNPEVLYAVYSLHSRLASDALHDMTGINADSAWVHEVLGQNYMAQEQYAAAVREFRLAVERGPRLLGLRFQLGEALLAQANSDENRNLAEKEFQAELQMNAASAESLVKLGAINLERAKLAEAKTFLGRALAIRPNLAEAHSVLAKVLEKEGDVKGATAELESSEKLSPGTTATHYQLAQLYRKQGRVSESGREAAAVRGTAGPAELPDGAGKEIVETTCTECHDTRRIQEQHLDEEGWNGVVREMMETGASIDPENIRVIVAYLARNFGSVKQ